MITKSKIKSWLTVGACVLLAFTVAGVISNIFAYRPVDNDESELLQVPAYRVSVTPGEGLYAKREETLTFTYDGDYTAGDYDRGFDSDKSYVIGGTAENQKWIRTNYERNNIYLEIGKAGAGNPFVEFDRFGTYDDNVSYTEKIVSAVFEADFKWEIPENKELSNGASGTWFYRLEFNDGKYTGGNASHLSLYLYLTGDGFSITDDLSDVPAKLDESAVSQLYLGEWANLRVSFWNDSTYMVHLNGTYLCSGNMRFGSVLNYSLPENLTIEPRYYAQNTVIGLDNVFFGVAQVTNIK